jgi:hypothetical protein
VQLVPPPREFPNRRVEIAELGEVPADEEKLHDNVRSLISD